ncbi:hypothetical protein [Streptomyces adustus]
MTEQGWLLVESGVPGNSTALAAHVADYTVEVRFPGSSYRAVTGARQRIEVLAERLKIELTVTAVDLVRGRPDFRPHWTVFRPATGPQVPTSSGRLERLRRRAAELRGTGRQTRAYTRTEASALAARSLPGVASTPADARIRPSWLELGTENGGPGPQSGTPRRRLFDGLGSPLVVVLLVGFAVAQNQHTSPAQVRFWFFLLFVGGALALAATALRRNRPDQPLALVLVLMKDRQEMRPGR